MADTSSGEASPALQAANVQIAYGDLVGVWDVSLELAKGEITAIVGRNGAGKTTLLSGLAGLLPLRSGTVQLGGQDVTTTPPWARVSAGLSLVQEGKRIFRDLTVRENLLLGLRGGGVKRPEVEAALNELYDRFPVLGDRRSQRSADLSGGQQQMLAIATALAARPVVLLVDEPSSGLAPVVVDRVFEVLDGLRSEGMTILLVEQLVEEVLSGIAGEVIVLERGRVTMHDRAERLSVANIADRIYSSSSP